ncbi:MAG TPA: TadE/TadG family type IV pilus assembly protein [Candidatus Limnocylindrales bacterium]|nr:TadE/TadG family type IV pilus assembly protein [Candidatus Limnocylindrales bacterium]
MEFALVFPVIVFLVVAFIEGGRAVYSYTTITNAARDGARVAAVNQLTNFADCDETLPIQDALDAHWTIVGCAIQAGVSLGLQPSNVSISYSTPPGTTISCSPTIHIGCLAAVTVTYHYAPSTPLVSGVIPTVTLSATSQMPVERVFP